MKFIINIKKKNHTLKISNNMKRSCKDNSALNCGSIIGFISLSLSITCINHFP